MVQAVHTPRLGLEPTADSFAGRDGAQADQGS